MVETDHLSEALKKEWYHHLNDHKKHYSFEKLQRFFFVDHNKTLSQFLEKWVTVDGDSLMKAQEKNVTVLQNLLADWNETRVSLNEQQRVKREKRYHHH